MNILRSSFPPPPRILIKFVVHPFDAILEPTIIKSDPLLKGKEKKSTAYEEINAAD
jgi:hypothetical protein